MLCLRPQEYALPPYLPSRFLSWKVRKLQQCTIQVHHSSARYLYSNTVSATMHVHVSEQLAVKNWWEFRSGTKSPNRQIKTTTKFSHYIALQGQGTDIWPQVVHVDIGTMPFYFVYTCIMLFVLYSCALYFTHKWLMRGITIVHLMFYPLSLICGAWSTATIEVATRPQRVYELSSSHDHDKEQCLLLCIVLNFDVSKLPSPSGNFIVCTAYMHFGFVPSWLSRRDIEHKI